MSTIHEHNRGTVYASDIKLLFKYPRQSDGTMVDGEFPIRLMRVGEVWRIKAYTHAMNIFKNGDLQQSSSVYISFLPMVQQPQEWQDFTSQLLTTTYNVVNVGQMPQMAQGHGADFAFSVNNTEFHIDNAGGKSCNNPAWSNTYWLFDQTVIRTPKSQGGAHLL